MKIMKNSNCMRLICIVIVTVIKTSTCMKQSDHYHTKYTDECDQLCEPDLLPQMVCSTFCRGKHLLSKTECSRNISSVILVKGDVVSSALLLICINTMHRLHATHVSIIVDFQKFDSSYKTFSLRSCL